jgi:hypothetical protein
MQYIYSARFPKEALINSGNAGLAAILSTYFVAKPRRTYEFAYVLLRVGRQTGSKTNDPHLTLA